MVLANSDGGSGPEIGLGIAHREEYIRICNWPQTPAPVTPDADEGHVSGQERGHSYEGNDMGQCDG